MEIPNAASGKKLKFRHFIYFRILLWAGNKLFPYVHLFTDDNDNVKAIGFSKDVKEIYEYEFVEFKRRTYGPR